MARFVEGRKVHKFCNMCADLLLHPNTCEKMKECKHFDVREREKIEKFFQNNPHFFESRSRQNSSMMILSHRDSAVITPT